ncbi:MAG TPA: hypothetical protein VFL87_02820 [Thermoleophilaceae bacterium]|nr:hypothetical protein [Thermoleophilaceae bacterium]
MAEDETTQQTQDIPAVIEQAQESEPPPGQSPWEAHAASGSSDGGDPLPIAGAAFVGGFVLAKLLKKLGGGDD